MSEKKTIQINPDLFRFSTTNKTRKKRDDVNKPIKIKSPSKSVSSKTVRNRLLKYIRQQQDTNSNKQPVIVSSSDSTKNGDPGFESDFEDSLKYLSSVAEKTQNAISPEYKHRHNTTFRHFEKGLPPTTESLLYGSTLDNALFDTNVGIELPDVFTNTGPPIRLAPKYGCLKNGVLPTYRMWKNQTLRTSRPDGHFQPSEPTTVKGGYLPLSSHEFVVQGEGNRNRYAQSPSDVVNSGGVASNRTTRPEYSASRELRSPDFLVNSNEQRRTNEIAEMKKQYERKKATETRPRPKPLFKKLRQKRTLRRTYHVGKSKHYPRVGVLVSNKTLRKQITTKAQLLKQVPMDEVKKTLIKKGFIKVGSTAPTDVLRKMFESISLVCGDIQNHNPDNLLYNYLNGTD